MTNITTIKIPKGYQPMLNKVWSEVEVGDGYWATTNEGFYSTTMMSHTLHEETQADLLREIRCSIAPETYEVVGPNGKMVISGLNLSEAKRAYATLDLAGGFHILSQNTGDIFENIVDVRGLKRKTPEHG